MANQEHAPHEADPLAEAVRICAIPGLVTEPPRPDPDRRR
jgi:hypothetical protein